MATRLRRRLETLRTFFDSPNVREINNRQVISDTSFHLAYYANTEITYETCVGVRSVLFEQLRLYNTIPTDNIAALFPDIELGEVYFEIGEKFGVLFLDGTINHSDGTVDSLIRETQRLLNERRLRISTD